MRNRNIKGIKLYNLRNGLYLALMREIIHHVNDSPVVQNVQQELDALEAGVAVLSPLYKMQRGSNFTKAIEQADFRRDAAVKGINMQINSYLHHYNADKQLAAKALTRVMKHWGKNVAEKNYVEESAIISAIVSNMTTQPTYKDAVTSLQLADWVDELQKANQDFNNYFLDRIGELGDKTKDRMKSKRLEVNKLYYKLREVLMAHAYINNFEEPYTKLIAIWNVVVKQIKQSTRKKGKDNDEEEAKA